MTARTSINLLSQFQQLFPATDFPEIWAHIFADAENITLTKAGDIRVQTKGEGIIQKIYPLRPILEKFIKNPLNTVSEAAAISYLQTQIDKFIGAEKEKKISPSDFFTFMNDLKSNEITHAVRVGKDTAKPARIKSLLTGLASFGVGGLAMMGYTSKTPSNSNYPTQPTSTNHVQTSNQYSLILNSLAAIKLPPELDNLDDFSVLKDASMLRCIFADNIEKGYLYTLENVPVTGSGITMTVVVRDTPEDMERYGSMIESVYGARNAIREAAQEPKSVFR